jgi:hypothetical protein
MKLQYTFTIHFFFEGPLSLRPSNWGKATPATPPPPRMEECTIFWVIESSWGINMDENKDL